MEKSDALQFHPLANRFPLMEGKSFDDFVENMRGHGYNSATKKVWLLDGLILDGRNTYRALTILNIAPSFEEWDGQYGDPWRFVRMMNLHRCHYTQGQLATMAAEEHERVKMPAGAKGLVTRPLEKSAAEVAKEFGVGESTLKTAKRVMKKAAESVKELVKSGHASAQDAAAVIKQPKEVQDAAAKKVASGEARTLAEGVRGDAHDGPEKPTASKGPLTDEVGQPIPKHLRDVFATSLFADYIDRLSELRLMSSALLAATPWWVNDADTTKKLREIEERIKDCRPYAVCPECDKQKKGCQTCRQQGWLPFWTFDEVKCRGGVNG